MSSISGKYYGRETFRREQSRIVFTTFMLSIFNIPVSFSSRRLLQHGTTKESEACARFKSEVKEEAKD